MCILYLVMCGYLILIVFFFLFVIDIKINTKAATEQPSMVALVIWFYQQKTIAKTKKYCIVLYCIVEENNLEYNNCVHVTNGSVS